MSFPRHFRRPILLILLLAGSVAWAAEKPQYAQAKLVDLRRYATGSGALRAQGEFCMAFELEGISYLVSYEPYGRWAYVPTNLVVGDPVGIRIKNDNLWFLTGKPRDNSVKTKITRRERMPENGHPTTCADPVAVK